MSHNICVLPSGSRANNSVEVLTGELSNKITLFSKARGVEFLGPVGIVALKWKTLILTSSFVTNTPPIISQTHWGEGKFWAFFHFRLINKHSFLPKCTWKEQLFVAFNKTQSWLKRITFFFSCNRCQNTSRDTIPHSVPTTISKPHFFSPTSMDYTLLNTQVIRIHSMWQYRRPDHAHPFMTQEHVLTIGTETQTQLFPQTE